MANNETPMGKFAVEGIVPYSSAPEFSDNATGTTTNARAVFKRKETPRIVSFTAGSKGKKLRKRRMR